MGAGEVCRYTMRETCGALGRSVGVPCWRVPFSGMHHASACCLVCVAPSPPPPKTVVSWAHQSLLRPLACQPTIVAACSLPFSLSHHQMRRWRRSRRREWRSSSQQQQAGRAAASSRHAVPRHRPPSAHGGSRRRSRQAVAGRAARRRLRVRARGRVLPLPWKWIGSRRLQSALWAGALGPQQLQQLQQWLPHGQAGRRSPQPQQRPAGGSRRRWWRMRAAPPRSAEPPGVCSSRQVRSSRSSSPQPRRRAHSGTPPQLPHPGCLLTRERAPPTHPARASGPTSARRQQLWAGRGRSSSSRRCRRVQSGGLRRKRRSRRVAARGARPPGTHGPAGAPSTVAAAAAGRRQRPPKQRRQLARQVQLRCSSQRLAPLLAAAHGHRGAAERPSWLLSTLSDHYLLLFLPRLPCGACGLSQPIAVAPHRLPAHQMLACWCCLHAVHACAPMPPPARAKKVLAACSLFDRT